MEELRYSQMRVSCSTYLNLILGFLVFMISKYLMKFC